LEQFAIVMHHAYARKARRACQAYNSHKKNCFRPQTDQGIIRAMPNKPKPKPDNPEQSKRFIDTAREREADETEEGADKAFKKVVTPQPKKS